MRFRLTWLLIFLLSFECLGQLPATDPLARFSVGAAVRVVAKDGRSFEGTVESKAAPDFTLRTRNGSSVTLRYDEIRSADALPQRKAGGKAKWIVLGVVAGVAAIVGGIFAVRLHNEGAI